MTEPATLTIEKDGHVMLVGLNRPGKRNAFNLQMLRDLSDAYTRYEKDEDLWCLMLFAHGEHFTAGLDLAEVGPAVAKGDPLFPGGNVDPMDLLDPRRTKPVVCAVKGWCLTIGVELLLASDIRLAASGTKMAQMEVRRGIMPFGGATLRFPQIAGWGNAMRYLLTGDEFDADEALRIGLVQEVVEPGTLEDRGRQMAQAVARQAPLAVRATRAASITAMERGFDEAKKTLMDEARGLVKSEDAMEGLMSFIERREARFKGR
ncbi:MAG: crotonase/enoyl-CoA hydratase family protein [Deltaproteobacteria bacterium]|nr:crotonase/enoyl-CoA hydratase family protein [Deltaproteobacteria bacterium]